MLTVAQAASTRDLMALVDAFVAFAANFWWLPVIVTFAWYLRWYRKAEKKGVDTPSVKGFSLWLRDVFGTTRRGVAVLAINVVGILGFLAFVMNILPAVGAGVASGDPIVISLVAGMVAAAGAALDFQLSTPRNTLIVVVAVFLLVVVADALFDRLSEEVD